MGYRDRLADAMKVRNRFRQDVEAIRANGNLSDKGKGAEMAQAWGRAQQQLRALRAAYTQERDARLAQVQQTMFYIGQPIGATFADREMRMMSFRQAYSEASAIKNGDEALKRLQRAIRQGDDLLALAIAEAGFERGWPSAVDAYMATQPARKQAMDEYVAITGGQGDKTAQLEESAAFTISRPKEVPYNFNPEMDTTSDAGGGAA